MDKNIWTFFTANTWSVVVTGLLVVFAALVVLVLLVAAMGKIFEAFSGDKKKQSGDKNEEVKTPPTTNTVVNNPPVVDTAVEDDSIVAAITAAISCLFKAEGNEKPFVIRSIKKANDKRQSQNAWKSASTFDNTRPF